MGPTGGFLFFLSLFVSVLLPRSVGADGNPSGSLPLEQLVQQVGTTAEQTAPLHGNGECPKPELPPLNCPLPERLNLLAIEGAPSNTCDPKLHRKLIHSQLAVFRAMEKNADALARKAGCLLGRSVTADEVVSSTRQMAVKLCEYAQGKPAQGMASICTAGLNESGSWGDGRFEFNQNDLEKIERSPTRSPERTRLEVKLADTLFHEQSHALFSRLKSTPVSFTHEPQAEANVHSCGVPPLVSSYRPGCLKSDRQTGGELQIGNPSLDRDWYPPFEAPQPTAKGKKAQKLSPEKQACLNEASTPDGLYRTPFDSQEKRASCGTPSERYRNESAARDVARWFLMGDECGGRVKRVFQGWGE